MIQRRFNRSLRHGKTTKDYFTLLIPMDERYKAVKALIITGQITEFRQIFIHIPRQVVADDYHTSPKHLARIMRTPTKITFEEIIRFSAAFDVDIDVIFKLLKEQYLATRDTAKVNGKKMNHT